jgi:hypothetical protein
MYGKIGIGSLLALVVFGLIVGDFLIHPSGTTAVANGISTVGGTAESGLLGGTKISG